MKVLGVMFYLMPVVMFWSAGEAPEQPQTVPEPLTIVATAEAAFVGPEKPKEKTIDELISEAFGDQARIAKAVMLAESGGDPGATNKNHNGSVDRGLLQINSVHTKLVNGDLESLYNPEVNIKVAKQIYDASGWRAWSAYKNKSYLKYIGK